MSRELHTYFRFLASQALSWDRVPVCLAEALERAQKQRIRRIHLGYGVFRSVRP